MKHDVEKRIRDRAYHLWEAAGRPHGRDQEFWAQAHATEHEPIEAPAVAPVTADAEPAKAAPAAKKAPVAAKPAAAKPVAAKPVAAKPAEAKPAKPARKTRPG